MKRIPFKTSDAYAFQWELGRDSIKWFIKPTKHFTKNKVATIKPERGLTKLEMKNLPVGITVVLKAN